MMPVGSKWELYLPADLAYGERQAGQIKPYSTLIFTVELEGIEAPKPTAPATTQPATKQPAKTATKTIAKKK
jgi:FKBP-type peptidyl-prolyl cis-trans isomerase FklB